jgi:hypothetical protein
MGSKRRTLAALLGALGSLAIAPSALAATLHVDDNGRDCPAAKFSSIQAAVNAAHSGDAIVVCPGTYVEGSGRPGTNALTIGKSLSIRGAGADLVTIEPRRSTRAGGQIAAARPVLRNRVGNIVSIDGGSAVPIKVDISGVTIDGHGVYSEVGVLYLDAGGSLVSDRVTDVVTSESNRAYQIPGGYRSNRLGIGVAQTSAATKPPPGAKPRLLTIDHTRIDRYNAVGVLIDGARNNRPPLRRSGVVNRATLSADDIVGRVECPPFNTPHPGPPFPPGREPGNCSLVNLTRKGPTFGQDGVRITAGSSAALTDDTISQNLVNGVAAPHRGSPKHNGNLAMGAGVRLIGAGATTMTDDNIVDNAYGVYNVKLDGTTPNTRIPVSAENVWWGLAPKASANLGPAISPTTNPPPQENPVNGTPVADPTCLDSDGTSRHNSTTVDFCPYRNGNQADPNAGELPVVDAPIPVDDAAPTVSLASERSDYNRGETVHLTAVTGDDFGVKRVTFYDGAAPIGTVAPSPKAPDPRLGFTIPAGDACASPAHRFTAVAEDSAGQTAASNEVDVAVVGPNGCIDQAGSPSATEPPTISFAGTPRRIPQRGVEVTADAGAGSANSAAVAAVDFFLGTRRVCNDTSAPFTCRVRARGGDVGDQALRAVATDTSGRTAKADLEVRVDRFAPRSLTIAMAKGRDGAAGRTIDGELELPARVPRAVGCGTGTVRLDIREGGATLFHQVPVSLRRDCSYRFRFSPRRHGRRPQRLAVAAAFRGNDVLVPAAAERRFR